MDVLLYPVFLSGCPMAAGSLEGEAHSGPLA